jgi:hypothetical protein
MRTNLSCFVVVMMYGSLLACGGGLGSSGQPNQDNGTDGGAEDGPTTSPVEAGTDGGSDAAPVDHGAPSSTYPAFPPSVGQLQQNGGYTMKKPVIVAITWNADTSQASFDTFADEVGSTAYWQATTAEYGVGPATSGTANHVHIATAPPATVNDNQTTSDIKTLITTNVGAAANPWPAATEDTIYAFFLPPGTSLLVDGQGSKGPADACQQGIGGYHQSITIGSIVAEYAVVPSCSFPGNPPAQQTTMSMSHELIESVTDPQQDANGQPTGLFGFDSDHWAFDYFQSLQSENGDACEFYRDSFYEDKETTPTSFDYWVQRTWSNKAAAAGHNPCAPNSDPYFTVTPLDATSVNVNLPSQLTGLSAPTQQPTKGYRVLPGSTGTFAVGFISDAPTSGPWTVSVAAGNPVLGNQSPLDQYNTSSVTVSVDKTSGQNGEKAQVTVNVTSAGSLFKGEIVTVTSTLNGVKHYMPIWIANQ